MIKFLTLVVILAVAVVAYPAAEEAAVQAPKTLSADGQPDLATKDLEADQDAGEGSDLKGAETFGFGYYPIIIHERSYGYGGNGGYGGYGGYGGGWGYGGGYGGWGWGYPRHYYW